MNRPLKLPNNLFRSRISHFGFTFSEIHNSEAEALKWMTSKKEELVKKYPSEYFLKKPTRDSILEELRGAKANGIKGIEESLLFARVKYSDYILAMRHHARKMKEQPLNKKPAKESVKPEEPRKKRQAPKSLPVYEKIEIAPVEQIQKEEDASKKRVVLIMGSPAEIGEILRGL